MVKNCKLANELIFTAANKTGVLADMCKLIAEAGVSISAFIGYVMDNNAKLHFVTDNNQAVMQSLKESGYTSCIESPIVVVEVENKAGELKLVGEKLARAGVDIIYAYASSSAACPATLLFSTTDNNKALLALK